MKSNKAAVRYAKALLELATDHNKVELIEADILQLLKVSNEAHDFQVFLNSPLINIDKKIAVIKQIFPDFNQTTIDFLSLVTNNGRESVMIDIAKQFISQLKAQRGIVPNRRFSCSPTSALKTTICIIVNRKKNKYTWQILNQQKFPQY